MSTYISLFRFTEKGAKAIKQSAKRSRAFEKAAAKAGVKVVGKYWTVGAYDGVLILSAKKSEQALHCLTELAATGNVTVQTLTAFDEKKFQKIVG